MKGSVLKDDLQWTKRVLVWAEPVTTKVPLPGHTAVRRGTEAALRTTWVKLIHKNEKPHFYSANIQKTWHKRPACRVCYSDCSQTQQFQTKGLQIRGLLHRDIYFSALALAAAKHGWTASSRAPFAPLAPLVVPPPGYADHSRVPSGCWQDSKTQALAIHSEHSQKCCSLSQAHKTFIFLLKKL